MTVPGKGGRPKKTERGSLLPGLLPGMSLDDPAVSERMGYVKAAFAASRGIKNGWKGSIAIPPGSLIDDICMEWEKQTNIPLEIPFHTFLLLLSGYLIEKGVTVDVEGVKIRPDVWTIILANSGSGKTWTKNELKPIVSGAKEIEATGAAGAAAWLQSLATTPQGVWIRDEFFQFLKQLDTVGPLSDVKDYLLRIYDNETITRETKRDKIIVEDPVVAILGFNVFDTFVRGMTLESLTDGFAQRFGYVIAPEDPKRPWRDYSIWTIPGESKLDWKERWEITKGEIKSSYTASKNASNFFKRSFKNLSKIDIPESFYRRIMWKSHKYALLYHVLRNPSSSEIDDEDYAWAARLIGLELSDAATILTKAGFSDLGHTLDAVEQLVLRLKEKGEPITVRAVVRGTRAIKTVAEARACLDILGISAK
ncbi:MAG: hypothetical protein ACYDBP_15515 [Leptospirales bacterium]